MNVIETSGLAKRYRGRVRPMSDRAHAPSKGRRDGALGRIGTPRATARTHDFGSSSTSCADFEALVCVPCPVFRRATRSPRMGA
jgi:hypothetical protein